MSTTGRVHIRAPNRDEKAWIERHLAQSWGSTTIVARGVAHDASRLPALLAVQDGEIVGLTTFRFADDQCELVSLDALRPREGIGSALLARVGEEAVRRRCRRLWLITTNDNLDAIRFYQRRGLHLVALRPGAVDRARLEKTEIPRVGDYGIPLRDEIDLARRV
jgi:ribosomal protein S18 acetylase RimI-like enzyme